MSLKPIVVFAALCLAACSDKVASGASEDVGITPLERWQVAGVSQKGPFVTGSTVNVLELDGSTLTQTGKIFKSSIRSDKGDFAISGSGLVSQYAMLEVDGYYRNEITGQVSSGSLVLNAITDLSHRENVNVNLLTHLEFDRVKNLVSQGYSVKKAKDQAEREIISTMAMNESSKKFEDMNIFESGDENGMLLAVSVLMQSDADVAGLTERMGKFSLDLEQNGSWNDSLTRTAIADWASRASEDSTFKNIRKNVLAWGISDTLPNFEKYVDMFWYDNYGLGECTNSNAGDTAVNMNDKSSRFGDIFICNNERWEYSHRKKSLYKGDFGTLVDARDGRTYKTVQIGDQVWMAENLKYSYPTNEPLTACLGDLPQYCENYGRIYSFAAAMDSAGLFGDGGIGCGLSSSLCDLKESSRGVCPEGWHLPSEDEWTILIATAGGNVTASRTLRSANDLGSDDYGFNMTSQSVGFWTSSKRKYAGSQFDHVVYLDVNNEQVLSFWPGESNAWFIGRNVRCIKDQESNN